MTNRIILLGTFLSIMVNTLIAQNLEVVFTTKTVTKSGATKYNPKHILAVWVETSDGKFVSSLLVNAQERIGYLTLWSSKSKNNKVNAVTGATLKQHQQHTLSWDCLKYDGNTATEGDYVLYIEETSGDATGPNASVPFTIGNQSYSINPSDGETFTGMSMNFSASSTSIKPSNAALQNVISVFPNPFKQSTNISFYLPEFSNAELSIVDILGKEVYRASIKPSVFTEHLTNWDGISSNDKSLPSGTYFCILKTGSYKTSCKIIKQ